jgi:hypothetical protein
LESASGKEGAKKTRSKSLGTTVAELLRGLEKRVEKLKKTA